MTASATFARFAAEIEALRARRSAQPPGPDAAREAAALAFEEIHASCRMAGAELDAGELAELLGRGLAVGGRPFDHYALAAAYADAARVVQRAEPASRSGRLVRVEEIVELHALATRHEPEAYPGNWRVTTARALRSGIVPPPFWLVPREIAAFVERVRLGPASGISGVFFVAQAHERFARIHPFAKGNGRVARLIACLLLRRLGLPPLIVPPAERARYRAALRRADSSDPWPLALLFARSVHAGLVRLTARPDDPDALRPLGAFGTDRAALYKAAQRDRLRTIRRGRALFATEAWVAAWRRR
jgi:Fic family protein